MAWQNVVISRPARLTIDLGRLCITQEGEPLYLPLEDIVTLTLENPQIQLTQPVLVACAQAGVAVMVCDAQHLPCGVLHALSPHSKAHESAHAQWQWTEAFRQECWQRLVVHKIVNQRAALKAYGDDCARLGKLSAAVNTDNAATMEAQAARIYFPRMFNREFRRHDEGVINSALDYGYAIVRATIARALTNFGFVPTMGLHHRHPQNAFNLADDLIEPFRPWVDGWVKLAEDDLAASIELPKVQRARLTQTLQLACRLESKTMTVQSAIWLATQSLVTATRQKKANLLMLPTWPAELAILDSINA